MKGNPIMKPLPLAALVAAAMLSTVIVLDVLWNAYNPDLIGPWLDVVAHPQLVRFVGVVHSALYVLLAVALIQSGRSIDGGRRFVTVTRWILVGCYGLFAIMYAALLVDPGFNTSGVYAVAVTVVFAGSLLLPIALGFALLRRRVFRVPALLLIAPLVLLPLTLLLEALTSWAHPGYLEIVVNVGLALLCIAASTVEPGAGPARSAEFARSEESRESAARAVPSTDRESAGSA
ncbi:MAG: hypothetical protein K0Q52_3149 [Microbacterium sp.]|jgi:hypothetical protein|nr:hypothetical protein [Microbacterium sp.]